MFLLVRTQTSEMKHCPSSVDTTEGGSENANMEPETRTNHQCLSEGPWLKITDKNNNPTGKNKFVLPTPAFLSLSNASY